ncbi:MAG: hypothetical protein LQ347_004718 [Umbilicaria vellea]|nr:MAG: hypothetical protein LQ347_004718 [Umbilicaria vellea]
MTATAKEIVQSYRRLYRHGLQAVQYSSPARHTLKDRLEQAYRNGSAEDFNAQKIETTIEFLSNAAKERGIANRIVKNLLRVWWWEKIQRSQYQKPKVSRIRRQAFHHFDMTVTAFNKSMGTCLPTLQVEPMKMKAHNRGAKSLSLGG